MAKDQTILKFNPVTVGAMQFLLEFEHRDGSGYWVSVTPWAKNTHPDSSDGQLVVIGDPGLKQGKFDDTKRYSARVAEQLKVAAIYEAAVLIAQCMRAYGKNLFLTAAAVLSDMNGVDVELLQQVADTYWPSNPPSVPGANEVATQAKTLDIKLTSLASFKRALARHPYWRFQFHATDVAVPNVGKPTVLASPNESVRRVRSASSHQAVFAQPPSGASTYLEYGKAANWRFEDASATYMDELRPDDPLLTYTAITKEEYEDKIRKMFPETGAEVLSFMGENL